jgi:hypothetical protein
MSSAALPTEVTSPILWRMLEIDNSCPGAPLRCLDPCYSQNEAANHSGCSQPRVPARCLGRRWTPDPSGVSSCNPCVIFCSISLVSRPVRILDYPPATHGLDGSLAYVGAPLPLYLVPSWAVSGTVGYYLGITYIFSPSTSPLMKRGNASLPTQLWIWFLTVSRIHRPLLRPQC